MSPTMKDTQNSVEVVQEFRASVDLDHGSTLTLTDQSLNALQNKLKNFLGSATRLEPVPGQEGTLTVYHPSWMKGEQPAGEINRLYKTSARSIGQRMQQREQIAKAA